MAFFGAYLMSFFPLLGAFPIEVSGPMLYLLHRGETEKAFVSYLSHAKECAEHDFALLQQAGKALLEQGIDSTDADTRLLCLFGAGVATSNEMLPILEKGILSDNIKTQLIALSYLAKQHDDEADLILLEALSSPFLITRLEALLQLAKKNHPAVMGHLHSLIVKVPDPIRGLFAQIAIHVEGSEAARFIRSLLNDPDAAVRNEVILTVAEAHRDDFLPTLRTLAAGASYVQQENCALAFGALKDHLSLPRLKEMAESKQALVKLAASLSLYELGEQSYLKAIEAEAKNGSLFAIAALGELKEGKEVLLPLLTHAERDVRLNALLSLLNMRAKEALPHLEEVLIDEGKDIGFWRLLSPGGGLSCWKTIPSASGQTKAYPGLASQTRGLREDVLIQCIEFEESDFLKIAQLLFTKRQHGLIPILMDLLENKKSENVIHFLKEGQQKAGAPLIRNYCTLALYRLQEEGPYEEQLISWMKAQGGEELIRFKEEDEEEEAFLSTMHQLTPEETSRFLVDVCESLASAQNQAGLEALLHTIAYGNPKNRYALAGLLMRTTE